MQHRQMQAVTVMFDRAFTQGESDIDCGGICPVKCEETGHCNTDEDRRKRINLLFILMHSIKKR